MTMKKRSTKAATPASLNIDNLDNETGPYRIYMYGKTHPDPGMRGLVVTEQIHCDSGGYPDQSAHPHVFLFVKGTLAGIKHRLNSRLLSGMVQTNNGPRNNGKYGDWTMLLMRNCLAFLNGSPQQPWGGGK